MKNLLFSQYVMICVIELLHSVIRFYLAHSFVCQCSAVLLSCVVWLIVVHRK